MFNLYKGTVCDSPGNSRDRLSKHWWALLPCRSVCQGETSGYGDGSQEKQYLYGSSLIIQYLVLWAVPGRELSCLFQQSFFRILVLNFKFKVRYNLRHFKCEPFKSITLRAVHQKFNTKSVGNTTAVVTFQTVIQKASIYQVILVLL